MEWLFRRHFWIVELAFVALAAIILAFALNKIIELRLVAGIAPSKAGSQRLQARTTHRDFDAANERNLFNAKREKANLADLPEGNCDHFWESEETSQRVRLVGTAVFANSADSLAYVEDSRQPLAGAKAYSIKECGGKGSRGFSFEDEDEDSKEAPDACNNIASVGEIKRIESECVYFYNTGSRRCEFMRISPLSVCNDRGDFKANTPLQEPQAPEKPGESIKKTGASTFEVERNDLNGLLDNLGQLLTQARVVPDVVDGKPAFKFVMVQPNSFFEKIGFKVGDVVTKINGSEVSIEKATEFIGKLRTDSQFNVEGTRDGSSFSYDYNVKR